MERHPRLRLALDKCYTNAQRPDARRQLAFPMAAWRLFCYVGESGLDARSRLLVVSVVVVGEEREALLRICERAEAESGKGRVKWSWAAPDRRINHMRALSGDCATGVPLGKSRQRTTQSPPALY